MNRIAGVVEFEWVIMKASNVSALCSYCVDEGGVPLVCLDLRWDGRYAHQMCVVKMKTAKLRAKGRVQSSKLSCEHILKVLR